MAFNIEKNMHKDRFVDQTNTKTFAFIPRVVRLFDGTLQHNGSGTTRQQPQRAVVRVAPCRALTECWMNSRRSA